MGFCESKMGMFSHRSGTIILFFGLACMAKGDPTPTPTCSPDFNYVESSIGGSIVAGTDDAGIHGDDDVQIVTLPFDVGIYDLTPQGAVAVQSNGVLSFADFIAPYVNLCLPDTTDYTSGYVIYAYWDDLDTSGTGGDCAGYPGSACGVYTSTSGTTPNRIFNIEWRAKYTFSGVANFEIRLYEGQTYFDIVYGTLANGNTTATSGVQKNDTTYTEYFCEGSGGASTGAHRYTLTSCISPTPTPSATASPSPTSTFTPTPTPTPTPSPTASPTPTPTCAATFSAQTLAVIHHEFVPSTQTDFPVLVSVTDNRLRTVGNGGSVRDANGYDIRPYPDASCGSALTYELERYNASTGELVMWVKIPSLSSSVDTIIYLEYGNCSLTTDGSSTATWSNNFISVYHLKNGSSLSVVDSVGTHNGTNHSATAATGKVDGAAAFVRASSQYVDIGTYAGPSAITLSAWVNPTALSSYQAIVSHLGFTAPESSMWLNSTGQLSMGFQATTFKYSDGGAVSVSTGVWSHVAASYDSSAGATRYINGAADGTISPNGALNTTSCETNIGYDFSGSYYFGGSIDEARISSVARSANWITTEYNNQNSPNTFVTLAPESAPCATVTPTPSPTSTPTATATVTPTPTPAASGWFNFFP